MTAQREPAAEHDCQCGSQARLWVDIGLDTPEPCCRACAARVAQDAAFGESLVAGHIGPFDDVLPSVDQWSPPWTPERAEAKAPKPRTFQRRRCLGPDCDTVTTAAGLGTHQKYTGHRDWVAA